GAPPGRRAEVHRRLGEIALTVEERARHLALSAGGPDEQVAAALDQAALAAGAPGAPPAAAGPAGRPAPPPPAGAPPPPAPGRGGDEETPAATCSGPATPPGHGASWRRWWPRCRPGGTGPKRCWSSRRSFPMTWESLRRPRCSNRRWERPRSAGCCRPASTSR